MLTVQEPARRARPRPRRSTGRPRERQIRWVHISELEDPTPFLSGGELLLTTGINLTTAARQREFVRLLAEREAAGLGFGTGFDHAELPEALVEEARARELPLFEVPYEMPFIALTERAFTKLVNDGYSVLERGIEVHALLEGLVLAEQGLGEVMRAIAESVSGAALLLDDRGRELARHPQERGLSQAAVSRGPRRGQRAHRGRAAGDVRRRGRNARRARRRGAGPDRRPAARAATGWSSPAARATSATSSG